MRKPLHRILASLEHALSTSPPSTVALHWQTVVETLRELERNVSMESAVDTSNELVVAYGHLLDEVGPERTAELLGRLEFHPVFTAHPTEAARRSVLVKLRRIADVLLQSDHPDRDQRHRQ